MDKAWFKNYDEGMPYTLQPYPDRTLVDVVSASARGTQQCSSSGPGCRTANWSD